MVQSVTNAVHSLSGIIIDIIYIHTVTYYAHLLHSRVGWDPYTSGSVCIS